MPDEREGTLVEAAASLFLAVVLFAAVRVLSLFGAPFTLFASAPLAVLCIRRGETVFLGASAAGAVLAGLFMGGPTAGAFLLSVAFPAILISRGLAFRWRPEKVVGIAAVVITVCALVALEAMLPGGIRPWVGELVTQNIAAYKAAGAPKDMVAMIEGQADAYARFMFRIMPMAFMWSAMALTVAGLLATRAYFARRPHAAVVLSPLDRWHLPDNWVWVLITAGVLALVPVGTMQVVGGNVLGVMALAYAFQGWAVLAHQFEARRVHQAVRIAVYLILLLWPVFVLLLVAVGVFDVWTDVRRVRGGGAPPTENPDGPPPSGPSPD